ncbi:MAG TPA: hemolysin family protein [Stellaceae bacterium]|nr:hemolysin family protein [Stellaceae bacterium]
MTDAPTGRPSSTREAEEGPFRGLRNWLKQLRGERAGEQNLRTSLEELIEEHEEQPIDPQERAILGNIVKLHEQTAADVMVPRVDIVALEVDTPFDQVVKSMIEQGHSRVPVYRETLDDVVGMLHIKDLLPYAADNKPVALAKIVRKVLFVAPSMPVLDLLLQMRLTRIHLALVVDEFGGVDGLLSIEDVIEQIVGEIEDEHDPADPPQLIERPDGSVIVEARMPIDRLEDATGQKLLPPEVEEEINTLGGLVTTLAGRVPARGEVIRHPAGFDIEVLDADPRRVKRLRLRGLPVPPSSVSEVEHA